jgi:ABC-type antimicrobial peptide transport system permease subunit
MALGATGGNVVRIVLAQGMGAAIAGIVIGVGVVLFASRALDSLLYNIKPNDPATVAGTAMMLLTVVVLAILLPATRASRIAPVEALRAE